MAARGWSLLVAGLLVVACDGGDTKDTADTEADTDTDTDADTDTDTDTDTDLELNPYSTYTGTEEYVLAFNDNAGDFDKGLYDCQFQYDVVGTPVEYNCYGCDFTFDVSLTYDKANSDPDIGKSGTCPTLGTTGADASFVYGYMPDYYGYGPQAVVVYYEYGYAFAPASFDGSTFEYDGVSVDYEYADYYGYYPQYKGQFLSRGYRGSATVSK